MPIIGAKGSPSSGGFGQFAQASTVTNYIEDVFSTYLYTGNGSTQTITNGIDLSTKGGLVWGKGRSGTARPHFLFDTARGDDSQLSTNSTAAASTGWSSYFDFNSNGFGFPLTDGDHNANGETFASWTFRKQPKFFDVVTYTGNGSNRNVSHSLGSAPGCIIIKCTSTSAQWVIWHRSGTQLNNYCAYFTTGGYIDQGTSTWGTNGGVPSMTSTTFSLGSDSEVNTNGATYIAYLFAHNAGGFGLTGTDNVISCGSFTLDGSGNATVNLGYEPQFVLYKRTDSTSDWRMLDTMRGWSNSTAAGSTKQLAANTSSAEANTSDQYPTATGFQLNGIGASGATWIYIAIRRGPMKVPTSGTSVFEPVTTTAANFVKTTLEAVDMGIFKDATLTSNFFVSDRLRGIMSYFNPTLYTNLTNAEATPTTGDTITSTSSEGTGNGKFYFGGAGSGTDKPTGYAFKRAPNFFDEVCYTGTGSATTFSHNLQAVPELMIVKRRSTAEAWYVYSVSTGNTKYLFLNATSAPFVNSAFWNNTTPTSTVFTVGTDTGVNASGSTYVAYLFATLAGVSKVGSYTGTGTSPLSINCGFTGGARFVMIKRTDSTGDWYVWDTARGMVSGTDPYLLLNSTTAEVNTDRCFTATGGFQIINSSPTVNAVGGTYIYLAIA